MANEMKRSLCVNSQYDMLLALGLAEKWDKLEEWIEARLKADDNLGSFAARFVWSVVPMTCGTAVSVRDARHAGVVIELVRATDL